MRTIPESDWKLFRELSRVALDRFCQQVLDEIGRIAAESEITPHERYLKIYKVVQQRDDTLAEAFNDMRRSTALMQLAMIHALGLITMEEIGSLSQEACDFIALLSASGA